MTDTNQKLREAMRAFEKRGTGFDSCPTRRLPQSDEAKQIDQWWLRYFMDADLSVRSLARQALALPTAEQVDDINVAESFTSVTKTAAPVGERELPPVIAYRLDYPAPEGVGLPRFFGADDGERAHTFAFNHKATITELYARAALSAGDAVNAQRYRWLREQSDDDFAFAVVKNPHFDVYESPEELDAAIDAAMRKGQL